MVVPGSGLVKAQAEAEGLDKVFTAAGFEWREPGCSMCLAMNPDKLAPGERCASTSNRNFEGRQGYKGRTHLGVADNGRRGGDRRAVCRRAGLAVALHSEALSAVARTFRGVGEARLSTIERQRLCIFLIAFLSTRNDDKALEPSAVILNREGFPNRGSSDSTCWLGGGQQGDGESVFPGFA